jgi:hypothetical protein
MRPKKRQHADHPWPPTPAPIAVGSASQQGALVVNGLNTAGLTVFGKTTSECEGGGGREALGAKATPAADKTPGILTRPPAPLHPPAVSKTLAVGQTCTCSNLTPHAAAGQQQSRKLL